MNSAFVVSFDGLELWPALTFTDRFLQEFSDAGFPYHEHADRSPRWHNPADIMAAAVKLKGAKSYRQWTPYAEAASIEKDRYNVVKAQRSCPFLYPLQRPFFPVYFRNR